VISTDQVMIEEAMVGIKLNFKTTGNKGARWW